MNAVLGLLLFAGASQEEIPYIETHVHLVGSYREGGTMKTDFDAAAETAVASMKRLGIRKCILMPPPFGADSSRRYDFEVLLPILKRYPGQFLLMGGGGMLNPMILEAVQKGETTEGMKREFEEKALEILDGGAIGFGEMAAMHFSFFDGHPFEEAPPDHPLFLLLADIAAKRDVPIDLHMEPVEKEISLPKDLMSPPNPEKVRPNIEAFGRLLSHNRAARIVWVHAGWEHTGYGTVDLFRRHLEMHENLVLSLKVHVRSTEANRPLAFGKLREAWRQLICDFPDRFVLGSDQFYGIPGKTREFPHSEEASRAILEGLPTDVAKKVATENAERVYKLK